MAAAACSLLNQPNLFSLFVFRKVQSLRDWQLARLLQSLLPLLRFKCYCRLPKIFSFCGPTLADNRCLHFIPLRQPNPPPYLWSSLSRWTSAAQAAGKRLRKIVSRSFEQEHPSVASFKQGFSPLNSLYQFLMTCASPGKILGKRRQAYD